MKAVTIPNDPNAREFAPCDYVIEALRVSELLSHECPEMVQNLPSGANASRIA